MATNLARQLAMVLIHQIYPAYRFYMRLKSHGSIASSKLLEAGNSCSSSQLCRCRLLGLSSYLPAAYPGPSAMPASHRHLNNPSRFNQLILMHDLHGCQCIDITGCRGKFIRPQSSKISWHSRNKFTKSSSPSTFSHIILILGEGRGPRLPCMSFNS